MSRTFFDNFFLHLARSCYCPQMPTRSLEKPSKAISCMRLSLKWLKTLDKHQTAREAPLKCLWNNTQLIHRIFIFENTKYPYGDIVLWLILWYNRNGIPDYPHLSIILTVILFLWGYYSQFSILSSRGYILTRVLFSFWYILTWG